MTIIGIDDTDSRTKGMCTTYIGHLIVSELEDQGYTVSDTLLVRLNPAAKHKTRGNATVAIHTNASPQKALDVAESIVFPNSEVDDPETNPGIVVARNGPTKEIAEFTLQAIHTLCDLEDAIQLIERNGYLSSHQGNGRGRIGSLAAIGAREAIDDWTYEHISYREEHKRGTEREVAYDRLFEVADEYYPEVWDTVDRTRGDPVCVPHAPGPILFGIRGDTVNAVSDLTTDMHGHTETIESDQIFKTNQGTDVHLQDGSITEYNNDQAYTITGRVSSEPETIEGGHVFFTVSDSDESLDVASFEPTKHFRDKVRNFRVGDELTLCGEISDDTLKLEKFKVNKLNKTEKTSPICPSCSNTMKSAGANAGYRCRDCSTSADSKKTITVERDLEQGWYEVPPCARRHISKPLIRGNFNSEIHPFT